MVRASGRRLAVGVMTPHAAAGPEVEIPEISQGRVTVTLVRIGSPSGAEEARATGPSSTQALRALAQPGPLDAAAASFADGSVDAVVHASTTTGYVLGAQSEAALVQRIAAQCGVPAVGSAGAVVDALRACGVDRLALVHPPWFDHEMDGLGVGYFRDQGFDVRLLKAAGLPGDPSRVRTADIVDWVSRHVGDGDEALFLAGNGFRAARAVAALEQRTSRLILTANQVLLWSALAATQEPMTIEGFGRLFRTLPTPTD